MYFVQGSVGLQKEQVTEIFPPFDNTSRAHVSISLAPTYVIFA